MIVSPRTNSPNRIRRIAISVFPFCRGIARTQSGCVQSAVPSPSAGSREQIFRSVHRLRHRPVTYLEAEVRRDVAGCLVAGEAGPELGFLPAGQPRPAADELRPGLGLMRVQLHRQQGVLVTDPCRYHRHRTPCRCIKVAQVCRAACSLMCRIPAPCNVSRQYRDNMPGAYGSPARCSPRSRQIRNRHRRLAVRPPGVPSPTGARSRCDLAAGVCAATLALRRLEALRRVPARPCGGDWRPTHGPLR